MFPAGTHYMPPCYHRSLLRLLLQIQAPLHVLELLVLDDSLMSGITDLCRFEAHMHWTARRPCYPVVFLPRFSVLLECQCAR